MQTSIKVLGIDMNPEQLTRSSFLGFPFQNVALAYRDQLEALLKRYPQPLSGYTTAMLIAWNPVYAYQWTCLPDQTLLIALTNQNQRQLLQPVGEFNRSSQELLLQAVRQSVQPPPMIGVTEGFLIAYPDFVSHFQVIREPGHDNYVYSALELATLPGRRYSKKRNLIAQADTQYPWTAQPLEISQSEIIGQVLEHIGDGKDETLPQGLSDERQALQAMLAQLPELNQRGILIRVDGRPVAFSLYETLLPDTAVVHFEKAERNYKGLFQLINRETARAIVQEGFQWINREEDLDMAGLRKSKLSYHPKKIVPSHVLKLI